MKMWPPPGAIIVIRTESGIFSPRKISEPLIEASDCGDLSGSRTSSGSSSAPGSEACMSFRLMKPESLVGVREEMSYRSATTCSSISVPSSPVLYPGSP